MNKNKSSPLKVIFFEPSGRSSDQLPRSFPRNLKKLMGEFVGALEFKEWGVSCFELVSKFGNRTISITETLAEWKDQKLSAYGVTVALPIERDAERWREVRIIDDVDFDLVTIHFDTVRIKEGKKILVSTISYQYVTPVHYHGLRNLHQKGVRFPYRFKYCAVNDVYRYLIHFTEPTPVRD